MKTLVHSVLILWITFLLMHVYYFLLALWNRPHPSYIPLLVFLGVQLIALAVCLGIGFWIIIFGTRVFRQKDRQENRTINSSARRFRAFSWIFAGILPVFIWYSQVSLCFQFLEDRNSQAVEPTWFLTTAEPIASALIDGIGRYNLPYRIEGKKIVMFYDEKIDDPLGDVAKMDAFIQQEEKTLGMELPMKIHWFRGPIFAMPGFAMNGIAVADPTHIYDIEGVPPKDKIGRLQYVDFHEISHNTLPLPTSLSFITKNSPPGFLVEGWAEARTVPYEYFVNECRYLKSGENALLFRVLASPKYYHQSENRIYTQGGAFVHFLLKTYGAKKFYELYTTCSQETFLDDFEKTYGLSIDQVDVLFWKDIQENFSFEKATENLSEQEKELLRKFKTGYEKQREVYNELISQGTFRCRGELSIDSGDRINTRTMSWTLRMCDEKYFRCDLDYTRSLKKLHEIGLKEEIASTPKRTNIDILFPEFRYRYIAEQSSTSGKEKNTLYVHRIPVGEWINEKKSYLNNYLLHLRPFSLFNQDGSHNFENPELYFWNPSNSTTVRSVIKDENGIVKISLDIVHPSAQIVEKLVLKLDSEKKGILLKAEHQYLIDSVLTLTQSDSLEYEGAFHGLPLLKKRTYKSESFGEFPSKTTNNVELVEHDLSLISENELIKGLDLKIPKQETRWTAKKMLQRDMSIIVAWFVAAMICVFVSRKS